MAKNGQITRVLRRFFKKIKEVQTQQEPLFITIIQNFQISLNNIMHIFTLSIKINVTLAQVFSCELCEIFKNTFFKNTYGRLLLWQAGFPLLFQNQIFGHLRIFKEVFLKNLRRIWQKTGQITRVLRRFFKKIKEV